MYCQMFGHFLIPLYAVQTHSSLCLISKPQLWEQERSVVAIISFLRLLCCTCPQKLAFSFVKTYQASQDILLPTLSLPCWFFQYAEYSPFLRLSICHNRVVDLGGEKKKVASADSRKSIFSKKEQPQLSSNPCAMKKETPKSVTHFKLNRLVLPILFVAGRGIWEGPLWYG